MAAKRVTEILEGSYLPKRNRSLTVSDGLSTYWEEHLKHMDYGPDARCLLTALDDRLGRYRICDLKKRQIEQYKRERSRDRKKIVTKNGYKYGKQITPRTVQAELQQLNMCLNHLVDNEIITANPISRFIKVKQRKPRKIVLDEGYADGQQWEALWDELCEDLQGFCLCLYETAMRPKEVRKLRWDWIDEIAPERWMVVVPEDVDKNKEERRVPVSLKLYRYLSSLERKPGEFVFPSPVTGGERLELKTGFGAAVRRANLSGKGITPYALRRTRLTIWDSIDGDASKYAGGHAVGKVDIHHSNYVRFTNQRLFKLVGLEYDRASDLRIAASAA